MLQITLNLKEIVIIAMLLIALTAGLFWFVSVDNLYKRYTGVEGYAKIYRNLDLISNNIMEKTDANLVYVLLFHEQSNRNWFTKFTTNRGPVFSSAVFINASEGTANPIQQRQNIPLLSLPNIAETLDGKCTDFVTGVNHSTNSSLLSAERIQTRCPIKNADGEIIGMYGISIITNGKTEELQAKIPEYTNLLLDYKDQIESNFR